MSGANPRNYHGCFDCVWCGSCQLCNNTPLFLKYHRENVNLSSCKLLQQILFQLEQERKSFFSRRLDLEGGGPSYSDDVCLSEIFSINLVRNCKIQEDSSLLTITSNFPLKSNYLHRQPLCAILHNGKLGGSDNILKTKSRHFLGQAYFQAPFWVVLMSTCSFTQKS